MNYSYDAASELTGITYTQGSNTLGTLSYAYDAAGRRTVVGGSYARTGVPQAASPATYNVNNQLTNWKGATLTYDANGNLTSDGSFLFWIFLLEGTYTWNARNQLVSISGGVTASFQYDPFGRRVSKTIGGTTQFLYDGANPVQEISGSSASANLVTGGVDEYFQRTDSAGARSFLTDALGSTLALADSTGTVQTSYTFEPFGNTTVAGSSTTNSFAYTGRELDASGLYFYRARYYSPLLQRFISEDPVGFNGGINIYAYAGNNAVSNDDPFGLCTDPGGTGKRYCIDRYIPTLGAGFPFELWDGNNRGPNANGGGYKTEQLIFKNGGNWRGYCQPGTTTIFGHLPVRGTLGPNGVAGRKDGHILASCSAGIGHAFGLGPDIHTDVEIDPNVGVVKLSGTSYPSLEIWQYQDGSPPQLLLVLDATGGSPVELLFGSKSIDIISSEDDFP